MTPQKVFVVIKAQGKYSTEDLKIKHKEKPSSISV